MLAPLDAIHKYGLRLALFLALTSTALNFTSAQDSTYESDEVLTKYIEVEVPPPDEIGREERAALRKQNSEAKRTRAADKNTATDSIEGTFNQASVKPYLDGYILAQMTQTDDETLSKLGSLRNSFLKDYVQDAPSGNREQLLNTVIIPFAQKVTGGNYHPAVKLNAVLLIGMINGSDPSRGIAAQPSSTSVNYLIGVMNDENAPEFLKVGAMSGLHRVTQFDSVANPSRIDSGTRGQIGTMAFDITKKAYAGQAQWKAETSYWLRRRSIQMLGFLKDPGAGNDRANTLFDIVTDSTEKLWIRFDAMMALRQMNLTLDNADKLMEISTLFLVDALRLEARKLEIDLNELVAINLLYGSVDLLGSEAAGGGGRGGGGRAPGGRGGGGRGGGGRGGGGRGGGGGDAGANRGRGTEPIIDLPIYRTNDARRYAQGLAANVVDILTGLETRVSGEKDELRKDLLKDLNKFIEDANVGLIDRANPPEPVVPTKNAPPKGIADQMIEMFNGSAKQLENLVKGTPANGVDGIDDTGLPGQ